MDLYNLCVFLLLHIEYFGCMVGAVFVISDDLVRVRPLVQFANDNGME